MFEGLISKQGCGLKLEQGMHPKSLMLQNTDRTAIYPPLGLCLHKDPLIYLNHVNVNPVSGSPAHADRNNMLALTIVNIVKCAKIRSIMRISRDSIYF